MIEIKVSGHINMTKYCATDQEAYLFLLHIKDAHTLHLHPLIKHLERPNPYFYNFSWTKRKYPDAHVGPSWDFQLKIRPITENHKLKIQINHIDDDLI